MGPAQCKPVRDFYSAYAKHLLLEEQTGDANDSVVGLDYRASFYADQDKKYVWTVTCHGRHQSGSTVHIYVDKNPTSKIKIDSFRKTTMVNDYLVDDGGTRVKLPVPFTS